MRKLILSAFILLNIVQVVHAHRDDTDNDTPDTDVQEPNENLPILVIGASFGNGNTPFDSDLSGPLLGTAVSGGNYLSLGDALVRAPSHNGYVINEAQAGATSFSRPSCRIALFGGACSTAEFESYETQLMRAAYRVRSLATGEYNAEYVIITTPNDCLHSDAFGLPEVDADACDLEDMYDLADRLIEVGNLALSMGLMPVFADYPPVDSVDLDYFSSSSLLSWTISESDYSLLNETVMGTLRAELPEAMFINYWETFEHIGDGIHPTPETATLAANTILQGIDYAANVSDTDESCDDNDSHHGHDKHGKNGKHGKGSKHGKRHSDHEHENDDEDDDEDEFGPLSYK